MQKRSIMKKNKLPTPPRALITELAFRLVLDSEEVEGFQFKIITADRDGNSKYINVEKNVILEFLENEFTKVSVRRNSSGTLYLLASNTLSNESVKIEGLADHYLALLNVVDRASKSKKILSVNPNAPILSHGFIKEVNLSLQTKKDGEIGIGEYRLYDFMGNPVKMCVTTVLDGVKKPILSVPLCEADDVEGEMNKLLDFANSIPSRVAKGEDAMKLMAIFQTRFFQIHPFRDGNGRTARLLTNYLLLAMGKQIISIPISDKNDYVQSVNYANSRDIIESTKDIARFPSFLISKYHQINSDNPNVSNDEIFKFMAEYRTEENKYDFLTENLKKHQLGISSRSAIASILNNYGQKNVDFHFNIGSVRADQIDFEKIL